VKGTFNTLRLAAKRLRQGGRIVNLSSSIVGRAVPGYSVYAGTNRRSNHDEYFCEGTSRAHISVNAVAPGPIATDLFLKGKSDDQIADLAKMPPLERLGQPEDVAATVSFLVGLTVAGSTAKPSAPMAALFETNILRSQSNLEINSMNHHPRYRRIERLWRPRRSRSGSFGTYGVRKYARHHGRNAKQVKEVQKFASENDVDLRAVELDVASQESSDAAIQTVIAECGRLDVVIHNAGHMVFGPAEAFTPEQLAELYDINVLSTQRVIVPLCSVAQTGPGVGGLGVQHKHPWGTPPYLAPYFAAKAAMDALAVSYAGAGPLGVETSIIVRGLYLGNKPFRKCWFPVTRQGLPNTNPARMRALGMKSVKDSPQRYQRMRMFPPSRKLSSRSLTCRLANALPPAHRPGPRRRGNR